MRGSSSWMVPVPPKLHPELRYSARRHRRSVGEAARRSGEAHGATPRRWSVVVRDAAAGKARVAASPLGRSLRKRSPHCRPIPADGPPAGQSMPRTYTKRSWSTEISRGHSKAGPAHLAPAARSRRALSIRVHQEARRCGPSRQGEIATRPAVRLFTAHLRSCRCLGSQVFVGGRRHARKVVKKRGRARKRRRGAAGHSAEGGIAPDARRRDDSASVRATSAWQGGLEDGGGGGERHHRLGGRGTLKRKTRQSGLVASDGARSAGRC
jgi:hypothetical protein